MSNKQAIEIIDSMIFWFQKAKILQTTWGWSNNIPISKMIEQFKEAKSRIQSLPDTDEWISVEESVPDDSHWYVLCYVKYLNSLWTSHYMDVLSYNNWKWSKDFEENNVTHWKPLPEVPKK